MKNWHNGAKRDLDRSTTEDDVRALVLGRKRDLSLHDIDLPLAVGSGDATLQTKLG